MDSQKLKTLLIFIFAIFFAIYLGVAAATAQLEAVAWVAGAIFVTFLLSLGKYVWTLIPIFSVLGGTLSFVPGYPTPWYAITPVVSALLLARFLMRTNDTVYRFTWLDALMVLQIFVLAQAYVRNPTGMAIFGSSEMIGGRPYMDYSVALFAYFVLATVRTDLQTVKKVILGMIILSLCDELLKGSTGFSGALSRAVSKVYTNVDYASNAEGANYSFSIAETRFTSLAGLGLVISQILFSFNRPLHCLLPQRPLRVLALLFSISVALLSGFRSSLIRMACFFITSTLIRRKPMDLLLAAIPGFLLFAGVMVIGPKELPFAAQRALSFLPIDVDESIRAEAVGSTEWRHEMWRLVLTSDRYIKNKYLGDGFGFSAAEQEAQQQDSLGFRKYQGDSIDAFIAKGSYHGWHVEAIRFTGVLGLIVGLMILFSFARSAWVLVNHYRYEQFYPFAIYLCLPFIIEPFYTLFVFGSYKGNFITYVAFCGMLRVAYGLYLAEKSQPATMPVTAYSPAPSIQLNSARGQRPSFNRP